MKYVTYASPTGPRVGYLDDSSIWDAGFDGDMVEFIAAGARVADAREVGSAPLLAPLRPRSLRDFLTFKGHLDNALGRLGLAIPSEWFTVPGYYKGLPDTVIGSGEVIVWPTFTDKLDVEMELACVIGRAGKNIAVDDALDYVFGYTIWNDVSARDVQTREVPLGLGPAKAKDWDGSNVLGPCIVTPDEFDAADATMELRINGELWGADSTRHMHHSFADLISYAAMEQTLHPGEVLGSGTFAGGSGLEQDRWVQPGDVVEITLVGVGALTNTIGRKGN
jgi:2-keto-4-pentenoate hydratase/2-oxohepta-3-ene-1,7-dioic acid hydratase in catechol pathway